MRVGILSDIHDHIANLRAALQKLQATDVLLCCGDLCSPFIIKEFGEGFTKPIHIVFGNNDADLFRITRKASEYEHLHLHGEFCELTLDGQRFAMQHFDNLGRALAASDAHDVVCFGHNHRYEVRRNGGTLVINPGEVMGELSGAATVVAYDTKSGDVQRHDLNA